MTYNVLRRGTLNFAHLNFTFSVIMFRVLALVLKPSAFVFSCSFSYFAAFCFMSFYGIRYL